MQQRTITQQVSELGTGLAVLGLGIGIVIFVVILGMLLFVPIVVIARLFKSNEGESEQAAFQREEPEAPRRLFDAPPHEQWLNAYDYWIYRLEDATNISFSQTPEGSFLGAVIVTTGPAWVFALPYALLDGIPGLTPFWIVLTVLGLFGVFAGWHLTQPAKLFPGDAHGSLTARQSQSEPEAVGEEDDGVLSLGEEL